MHVITKSILVFIILFVNGFTDCYSRPTERSFRRDSTIVTSDGTKLFLKISGRGPACIFVHGGPGAWSRSFEVLGGNVLEENLTMYYYDQRGSGRSASPGNGDFSLHKMIDDIERIRIVTGAKKVYLLAHSFGGLLAYNYAQKYPQHVEGLILLNATLSVKHSLQNQIAFVNTTLGTDFRSSSPDDVISTFSKAVSAFRQQGHGYKMLSSSKENVYKLDSVDNAVGRNYDFAKVALSLPEYLEDYTPATAGLKVPVLVITGTTDHNIGPDHYKNFRFPNQRTEVIEGGHILYYEQNSAFKAAVLDFVRSRKL